MKTKKLRKTMDHYLTVWLPRDPELEAGFASLRREGWNMGKWSARVIRERMQRDGLLPVATVTEAK